MKKTLLSLFAMALSLGMNAYTETTTQQRIVGYYTTDIYNDSGIGFPEYGEYDKVKPIIDLTPEILQHYDGAKVVGIRFALSYPLDKARVFLASVSADGNVEGDLVSENVASPQTGWNTVMLSKPYTISKDQEIVAGYEYKQLSIEDLSSMKGYTDECWPISCIPSGRTDMPLLVFCNIPQSEGGKGEQWYNFGYGLGNLSIQLIVEGNFVDYDLTPSGFSTVNGVVGTPTKAEFEIFNNSKESASALSYILTIDGVAQPEATETFYDVLPSGQRYLLETEIPAFTEPGVHNVSLEVTKVDGKENQAAKKVATGKIVVSTDGISGVVDESGSAELSRYTIDGVRLSAPQKGLNIVKLSDGRTVKVTVK